MGDERTEPQSRPAAAAFALRCDVIYAAALAALARRGQQSQLEAGRARLERARARFVEEVPGDADGPMRRLAARLGLDSVQQEFLWTAAAAQVDPRLAVPLDELGGGYAKAGLNAVAYAALHRLDPTVAHDLTAWLCDPSNPLVANGLLVATGEGRSAAARGFEVPGRACAYLRGDDRPRGPVAPLAAPASVDFDPPQRRVLAQLAGVLRQPEGVVIVVEGPAGSGRRAAIAQAAAGRSLIALDAAAVRRGHAGAALLELRREVVLADAVPVIGDIQAWRGTEPGTRGDLELGDVLDGWQGPVIATTTVPGLELGTRRPTVRMRWPVPRAPRRRELWSSMAASGGRPPGGDLEWLAHRYRIGPGGIARAVTTARALLGEGEALEATHLSGGVRHNIDERLGGLARRVELNQTWDELVLAEDVRDQLEGLIARIRHAPQVLEQWGYEHKLARGTGVAALFSGPPGTGKTMCAGLVARELDLELYVVDLSQVVSKWVGETEKQLGQIFDAAEEGHALLLFDEADALFAQRSTEVKGAVDRYANLEVNFLLQRIEAFAGITILTTNLDAAIDQALRRRLAAHVVFDAPDEDERATLWTRLTQTGSAPLAGDVDAQDLARAYPKMTGAHIRNAALGAAFLAAAEGLPAIDQDTLHRAARVEYRAMGHVLASAGPRGRSSLLSS